MGHNYNSFFYLNTSDFIYYLIDYERLRYTLWIIMVMLANTFKALTLCQALTYTVNL